MSVNYESPKLTKEDGRLHDSVETHPSYAQIGASRVSGHTFLYGSDFYHQHYIMIRICKSQVCRGLSNDWVHGREQLIEVALSEAQWATFVSSMNQGDGTQCTLQYFDGESLPRISEITNRKTQFNNEAHETVSKAIENIHKIRETVKSLKISQKAKDEMCSQLENAERAVSSSVKFVREQFSEHMEKVTEHAKIEVNAYITNAIMRSGVASLQGEAPLLLENK